MTSLLILFTILALTSSSTRTLSTSEQIISALQVEIQKIASTTPSNAGSYVNNINSQGSFNSDSFTVNMTLQVLESKLKLPQVVVEKFKNIIFSDSLTFQTFTQTLNQQTAAMSEFIGAARKVGDVAEIAFLQVSSTGNVYFVYNSYINIF